MKYKLPTLAFSLSVIAISIYGLMRPSYDLGLILDLGLYFTLVRITAASILLLYAFVPALRLKVCQLGMMLCGLVFLGAGLAAIFSPMMFGSFSHYTAIGDLVVAIESGVLGILLAAELRTKPRPQTFKLPRPRPAYNLYRLPALRLPKLKTQKQLIPARQMAKLDLTLKQTA